MKMRTLAIFPILFLLVQSCMPDSFTKFKEDPVKKADTSVPGASGGSGGGSGGDVDDPPPPVITENCPDGNLTNKAECAQPPFIMFDASETRLDELVETININERRDGVIRHLVTDQNFGEPIVPILFTPTNSSFEVYQRIFDAEYDEQVRDLMTYTFQLKTPNASAPATLNFDIDGEISGSLNSFQSPLEFLVSATYSGETPVDYNEQKNNAVSLEISSFHDINDDLFISIPVNQGITVDVDSVDNIEVGDELFTAPGSSFTVNFINEATNRIVGVVSGSRVEIIPTETRLYRANNFNSSVALINDYSISLKKNETLGLNPQSGNTLLFEPLTFLNNQLSREELDFYEFTVTSPDGLPAGLSIASKSVCSSAECLAGSAKKYCKTFNSCIASGFSWVNGGTIFGTPTADDWANPRTITVEAQGPQILTEATCSDSEYYTRVSCVLNGGTWTPVITDLQASASINLGVSESPQRIAYEQQVGDRLRIPVSTVVPFAVGQTISMPGANSPRGQITRITASALIVNITNGGRCLDDLLLNRDDCVTTPGFRWQPHLFLEGASIDRVAPFATARATITGTPIHDINASGSFSLNLLVSRNNSFNYVNLLSPAVLSDFSFTTFPSLDLICGSVNFVNGSLNCLTNDLPSSIEQTAFTFTVVSPSGRVLNTDIPLMFQTTEKDNRLAMTTEVLLKIQNPSGFKSNDFISSNNIDPGLGIVREVSSKTILGINYDFVWVHVLTGRFASEDSVDRAQKYFKQVGLVSDVSAFSAVLNVPGPGSISTVQDYFTNGIAAGEQSMIYQGATLESANGVASVIHSIIDGANSKLFIAIDSGYFDTSSGIIKRVSNDATVVGGITSINGKYVQLSFAGSAATSASVVDQNIVQTNSRAGTASDAVGMIRSKPNATTAIIDVIYGTFTPASLPIHFENPIPAATDPTVGDSIISSRTISNYFLAHTSQAFLIRPHLFGPVSDDLTYFIFPDLPNSLTLDSNTGIISGTPTDRFNKTEFALVTSDGRSSTFNLEIKDYFQLNLTSTYSTYILHESGMRKNTAPCRVSRESILGGNAESKDITCFVEAGEYELFYKGLDLAIQMGGNMCTSLGYNPYSYTAFPIAEQVETAATRTVYQRVGDRCDPAGALNFGAFGGLGDPEFVIEATPGNFTNVYTPNSIMALLHKSPTFTIENEADVCDYNFSIADDDFDYPNCDIGKYRVRTINFVEEVTAATCNGESFTGPSTSCGTCPGDTSLSNQSSCDAAFPPAVFPAPPTADEWVAGIFIAESSSCLAQPTGNFVTKSCGGDANSCIGGNFPNIYTPELLQNIVENKGVSFTPSLDGPSEPPAPINFNFPSPEGRVLGSNISIANFPKTANLCTDEANLPFTFFSRALERYARSLRETFESDPTVPTNDATMGNPIYTFTCNDGSGIPQARIRLFVREWDQSFTSSNRIDHVRPVDANSVGQLFNGGDYRTIELPAPFDDRFTNEVRSWIDVNDLSMFSHQPFSLNSCDGSGNPVTPTAADTTQFFPLFLD
jgi:hypothetical protein